MMKITKINSLNGIDERVIIHYTVFSPKGSTVFDYEKCCKLALKVKTAKSRKHNMNGKYGISDDNLYIAFTFDGLATDEKLNALEAEICLLKTKLDRK